MNSDVETLLARMRREREIHCPHCDAVWDDDEHRIVSYWGEDSQEELDCENCEQGFWVEEHVSRTYTTAATKEGLEG